MSEEHIRIVSAAIIHQGRILLAQRAPMSSFPWHWCTPGGKVERWADCEADLGALIRELDEELGLGRLEALSRPLSVLNALIAPCFDIKLDPPVVGLACRVVCYRIHSYELPIAVPGDGIVGVGWFAPAQLNDLRLTPSDRICVSALRNACAT